MWEIPSLILRLLDRLKAIQATNCFSILVSHTGKLRWRTLLLFTEAQNKFKSNENHRDSNQEVSNTIIVPLKVNEVLSNLRYISQRSTKIRVKVSTKINLSKLHRVQLPLMRHFANSKHSYLPKCTSLWLRESCNSIPWVLPGVF